MKMIKNGWIPLKRAFGHHCNWHLYNNYKEVAILRVKKELYTGILPFVHSDLWEIPKDAFDNVGDE